METVTCADCLKPLAEGPTIEAAREAAWDNGAEVLDADWLCPICLMDRAMAKLKKVRFGEIA